LEGSARYAGLTNDLEPVALEEAPELAERVAYLRGFLAGEGALLASLSGSGASFFGLFDAAGKARRAQAVLESEGFRAFHAQTLTLDRYRRAWSESLRSARRAR
jgi:4-diphosphocytidyl-2C-methyl-D-erythritol kinase